MKFEVTISLSGKARLKENRLPRITTCTPDPKHLSLVLSSRPDMVEAWTWPVTGTQESTAGPS